MNSDDLKKQLLNSAAEKKARENARADNAKKVRDESLTIQSKHFKKTKNTIQGAIKKLRFENTTTINVDDTYVEIIKVIPNLMNPGQKVGGLLGVLDMFENVGRRYETYIYYYDPELTSLCCLNNLEDKCLWSVEERKDFGARSGWIKEPSKQWRPGIGFGGGIYKQEFHNEDDLLHNFIGTVSGNIKSSPYSFLGE